MTRLPLTTLVFALSALGGAAAAHQVPAQQTPGKQSPASQADGGAQIEQIFGRAVIEQQSHDLPKAIRDYQRVLELNPGMVDARVNLGAALAQAGRFDDAIVQDRVAQRSRPQNLDVQRNLALAYYKKGALPDAIAQFTLLHQKLPNDVQITVLLADSDVRSGKGTEALAVLEPSRVANAGNPDFDYVLGTAMIAAGQRRAGATLLQQIADATHSTDAFFLAGSTWLDLNEAERARKDLEQAMQSNPGLPHIATLTGMARDRSGDPDDAVPAFRQALKADPNDFDANLYLGAILVKKRELDEAKGYLSHALMLNPNSTLARYEVAMWKSTSGDYAAAVTDLEAVVKADPAWLDPHVELATVYYRLHRPEDGAKQRAIVAKLTEDQQTRGPGK